MQIEITENIPLLDENGHITKEGWAKKPYWSYDRTKIKARKHRIKEWDYYAILSQKSGFGLAFTVSDMGYMGFASILFLDFNNKFYKSIDSLILFPMGKLSQPEKSDEGIVSYKDKKMSISFETKGNERLISFASDSLVDFYGNKGIEGRIALKRPNGEDSIAIATSWKEQRTAFYYNQKINCMTAKGEFKIGSKIYRFDENYDTAVLDWGRGVWTYKNRWYWSSLSSYINGKRFGWNLGYGFSDRTPATENAIFYDGKLYKLDQVEFIFDRNDYLKNWKIIDNEGKLDIAFTPIFNRQSKTDLYFIKSIQNQIFGYFNGKVKLDDGRFLEINNLLGFAEDVYNAW